MGHQARRAHRSGAGGGPDEGLLGLSEDVLARTVQFVSADNACRLKSVSRAPRRRPPTRPPRVGKSPSAQQCRQHCPCHGARRGCNCSSHPAPAQGGQQATSQLHTHRHPPQAGGS